LLDSTEFLLKVDVERGQLFLREKIAVLAMLSLLVFKRWALPRSSLVGLRQRPASRVGKDEPETPRHGRRVAGRAHVCTCNSVLAVSLRLGRGRGRVWTGGPSWRGHTCCRGCS
jgi:hypothetical protein